MVHGKEKEVEEKKGGVRQEEREGGEGSGGGELNEEEWEKNRPRGWGEGDREKVWGQMKAIPK